MSGLSAERRSEIMLTNIDTSDCGVIALQAVTGLGRRESEELLTEKGYRPKVGTPRGALEQSLKALGYTVRSIRPDYRDTPATFSITHEYGRYLVYTEDHVMALVDGDLHNSRGSWRAPIQGIMEVTR